MAIAKWHGVKGEGPPTKNPAKAGKPGWDTEGSLSKTGDSWFTGEKPGSLVHPDGHRRHEQGPDDDHLHVRDPSVDARLDRSPAQGLAAHVESRFIPVPPGAPRFPRRPGRRRARRPAAVAGRRAVARLPVGRRPAPAAPAPGAAPSRPPCRYPGRSATRGSRSHAPGRGPGPSRPEDQDVDLRRRPSRGRRSGARRESAPRSPSSTVCPTRPASSPSTCTAATTAASTTASPEA